MIKIILFDDNRSICDSIGLLLSTIDDMRLVATYHNVEDVIDRVRKANPDVILMDIDMSGITGIEAVRQLRSKNITIPVIMLTGFEDADKVFASICAGANGYILKSANMNELVGHINDVYHGGAPMTPIIARKVLDRFVKLQAAPHPEEDFNLSKREDQVLQLLVKGKSYKMIAEELNISYETVHSHVRRIYQKLQVNSVSEAVSKTLSMRFWGSST
ncbi:MAG: response regulator transcription factor [Bacteroidetes bacterium]|jgi:DNA-binding NarL/FixJ family response regulator|nr:response regulator transcription factor [Bacteroidota bacterium]MBK9318576.1 response regulator transcription factor [Bacteroidota bacterium]